MGKPAVFRRSEQDGKIVYDVEPAKASKLYLALGCLVVLVGIGVPPIGLILLAVGWYGGVGHVVTSIRNRRPSQLVVSEIGLQTSEKTYPIGEIASLQLWNIWDKKTGGQGAVVLSGGSGLAGTVAGGAMAVGAAGGQVGAAAANAQARNSFDLRIREKSASEFETLVYGLSHECGRALIDSLVDDIDAIATSIARS